MIEPRMAISLRRFPPADYFIRPERKDPKPGAVDKALRWVEAGTVGLRSRRYLRRPRFVSRVKRHGRRLEGLSDEALGEEMERLRARMLLAGLSDPVVARSFALIRELAWRTLSMRHYDCQLLGGWSLLRGMVAEMETGEGKTLTATLAAGTAALAGIPVHVITVNDYLTGRDAEWMGALYRALGVSVGCIVHGLAPAERRAAYACDITYCTNKEVTFDYLRDWIALEGRLGPLRLQAESLHRRTSRTEQLLLRGLPFAIVDEADSVLIDEARTPLIISRSTEIEGERAFMEEALALAGRLQEKTDYRLDRVERKIELTAGGRSRIRGESKRLGPLWTGAVRREEIVRLALMATLLFHRDEQYLVSDGKVQIVDEFTGRVMPDRSYEGGLHQLIEIKEGCEITHQPETQARISYQRFFRRYLHLAGMTGTATEVTRELFFVYGLRTARIPPNRPVQRRELPGSVFSSETDKWNRVVERIREEHEKGRPVLIGTRSVAASERASRRLSDLGLSHQVLNAKQDAEEADIIARAGAAGCITIATNMAGRGTDILLGAGVRDGGGLHVLLTERHEAGRIDRQLAGRCGRQGDPGSYEAILSLEDSLLDGGRGGLAAAAARRIPPIASPGGSWLAKRAIRNAQKQVERLHARIRKRLLKEDERRGEMLSFSGRLE